MPSHTYSLQLICNISAPMPTNSMTFQAEDIWSKRILPQSYIQPAWNVHVAAMDVPTLRTCSGYQSFPLSTTNPTWFFCLTLSVQPYICTLNSRHFAYRTSCTTCICTLTLSTLLVENIISSIRINRMTTRSRWKFRIYTTTNDLTLYSFSSLYIFVIWGWPTVVKTCRQPNKADTKTVVFWRTYPLLTCIKHNGDDASKDVQYYD